MEPTSLDRAALIAGLSRAIKVAGDQSKLARLIGVSPQHVWHWERKAKKGVPGEYVLKIEAATGVSRHELRPDLYPPPAAEAAA